MRTETTQLKPCPFCGGKAETFAPVNLGWVRVTCRSCGAGSNYHDNEKRAITAWNTRAERTCAQKRTGRFWLMSGLPVFMCSNCGETFDENTANNYCPNCGAKVVE